MTIIFFFKKCIDRNREKSDLYNVHLVCTETCIYLDVKIPNNTRNKQKKNEEMH